MEAEMTYGRFALWPAGPNRARRAVENNCRKLSVPISCGRFPILPDGQLEMMAKKGDGLHSVLRHAFGSRKHVVIDCPVDYTENVKLTRRLDKFVCPI